MRFSTFAFSTFLLLPMPATAQSVPPPGPVSSLAPAYRIGLEDEIRLVVVGEDQFNHEFRVQADGSITIPLVGSVMAQGLTAMQLQDRIRAALAKDYFVNPQVRAEVSKYGSQFVMVQGEVRDPGRVAMTGPLTVMQALAERGSPTSNASSIVTIARRSVDETGGAPRNAEIMTVNLDDLRRGVAGADILLVGGDIINVRKAETFYVSGRVKMVGVQNWEPGLTVGQAITKAGGIDDRGRTTGIKIRRLLEGKSKEIEVKLTDPVQANDEIVVPARRF